MSFVNLHTHDSMGSLLDSIMTVEQIVDYAKKNNQSSIAITNHGYLSSFVSFGKYAKKKGIKAIYGCEIYDIDNPLKRADTKDYQQKRYHLILLAKNHQGLLDLFKIVSTSCTTFKYKKPLMSIDWIKENNLGKNIIALSACQAGRVSRLLMNDKEQEAKEFVEKLQSTFAYVALEIQSHSTDSQIEANKKIYSFVVKNNYPYVFTTDAHMVSKDQQETHSIFVQISEDREVGESYTDCFLQNENDIKEILGAQFGEEVLIKGMAETIKISDMIEDIDIGLNKGSIMPVVKIQEGFKNNEEYLRYLVYKDFDVKFKNMSEEDKQIRRDRIETELPILYKSNFTDYFIMLYMLVQESNNRGIPRGYSRGSGANCLCLYMLGVTQIDSIRWDLDFSRFANLGRKSLADFDWDISKLRRKEFVEISEELFGKENVAPICTFNTLSTKVAIRDIGKVLNDKGIYNLSYPLRDETAKMIPTIEIINESGEKQEKEIKLKEALLQNSKLAKIAEEYPLWIKYVVELEGLPKSMGRHAAGTLITPTPIIDYCPICQDSEGNVMTQIEMHSAMEDLGLIKMDYLGLETVDIVDNTLKLAGLSWDDVDINNIDLDDKKVYNEVYKTGNTTAVFQMESFEGKAMCIEAETDNIEDVIAINAFNRPGTKDGFPIYCSNKKNPESVEVLHPDLKEIFSTTQFVLLYQEQALQIFRYAGFPEEDVDNARRAIGHKQKEVMDKLHDKLCDGLTAKGWNDDQIETIWELLLKQSQYSFNRGHSVSYALLSYLTAYLKTYYPCEFFASCLSAKSDNLPKLSVLINECQRLSIKILPPNINKSGKEFTPLKEKNSILFGLLGIKGIGVTLVEKIIEEKNIKPFENINDFISRTGASVAQVVCLVKAGAIPAKNKKDFMLKYASSLFNNKEYTPVNSIPSAKILLEKWGLDINKIEKDKRLSEYNNIKEREYNKTQKEKFNKHIRDFEEKYLQDEDLWEYQTLSMFLSNNPFSESQKYIKNIEEIKIKQKGVVIGVVSEITKRNDKNGKQFAYLKIFSTYDVIEVIVWHTQYNNFQDLIKKGQQIAILVKKTDDNRLIAESFKTYDKWLEDRKLKK